MTLSEKEKSRKAGVRIFIYILTAFIILLSADAFFIYKAVSTHTGETAHNPPVVRQPLPQSSKNGL